MIFARPLLSVQTDHKRKPKAIKTAVATAAVPQARTMPAASSSSPDLPLAGPSKTTSLSSVELEVGDAVVDVLVELDRVGLRAPHG